MADEYVRAGDFGQFVKRMDERFDHVNKLADQRFDSMNQRFLDLEKRIEEGFAYVNQRFEQVGRRLDRADQRFDDVQAEIRILRRTMLALGVPVVATVVGAIVSALVKFLFFSS